MRNVFCAEFNSIYTSVHLAQVGISFWSMENNHLAAEVALDFFAGRHFGIVTFPSKSSITHRPLQNSDGGEREREHAR